MASVFEKAFGWNTSAIETAVPQLGINSPLNKLQIQSQTYFTIGENARASNGDVLAVSIKPGHEFTLDNKEQQEYLKASIALFKEKRSALQILDQKIVGSALLGLVASTLSFVPFVSYFSLLGWGSALYHVSQRQVAAKEYQESLNLLVANCNWSLGPKNHLSGAAALTQDETIRDMMTALYPALTEQQVEHLIADDIDQIFTQELRDYESKYRLTSKASSFFADKSVAGSKRSAEFNRCVYGYNKGKITDYLDAFVSVFPDIYNAIQDGFKRLQHWWNKDAELAEHVASDHAANV